MASYAMCHTKLDMVLAELGYKPGNKPPRLSVYLTNSLEEGESDVRDLFMAQWLTREAREANTIKRQTPIMCVIGNPPYVGKSTNKGKWIMDLIDCYKKEPGGKVKLKERNPKWLNDDYVKFIRLAEHLIERTGEGVVGFITNHGYLDNSTFRGMRWHLLQSFDKIYVLDLHGNSKKKEISPDGKVDKNVFDIQQGVAILIGVKNRESKSPCQVFHAELWGERTKKYTSLREATLANHTWQELLPVAPKYDFIPRDYSLKSLYDAGFGLDEFMPINSNGIVTARDALTIDTDKQSLWLRVQEFSLMETEEARRKYALGKDVQDWTVSGAQRDVEEHLDISNVVPISYRLFDTRWTFYTGTSRGFICRPRHSVMAHYLPGQNLGLLASKGVKDAHYAHVFVTHNISEAIFLSGTTGSNAMNFPLYLYPDNEAASNERITNFDRKLFTKLKQLAKDKAHGEPDELAVFDYIYGVLHCQDYRDTYTEFLKTDFPRIPWPESSMKFWDISSKGGQLRELHLMAAAAVGEAPYPYTGDGDDIVDRAQLDKGRIWINVTQYFDNVPVEAWEFWIGGYQPAQKWLKDRRGYTLSLNDILHYQRILEVLSKTQKIMATIYI
jgi:predicted helicase